MKNYHFLLLLLSTILFQNNNAIACVIQPCTKRYAVGLVNNESTFAEASMVNKNFKKQVTSFLNQHSVEKTLSRPIPNQPHQHFYRKFSFKNSQFYFEIVKQENNFMDGGNTSAQSRVYLSMLLNPKHLTPVAYLDKNESLEFIKEFSLTHQGLTFEGYVNFEANTDLYGQLKLAKISFKVINRDTVVMESTLPYEIWMPFYPYYN